MNELLELAERVEKAEGPDRELDCLLYEMDELRSTGVRLNLVPKMRGTYYGEPTGRYFDVSGPEPLELPYNAPASTASIDAAMSLVPEGWEGALYWGIEAYPPEAQLETWQMRRDMGEAFEPIKGTAKTPALALCAAALRARASMETSDVDAT